MYIIIISPPCLKKNCAFFLSELCKISTNFNKFWEVDDKAAEIVCYIYIVHLTWPTSLHYTLLNADVLNFYLTLDLLQSYCSDLVSEWRRHTVVTIFLFRGHCQTCTGCLETIFFYVSTWWRPGASSTRHRRCPGARDARNASSSKRLCPCMGHISSKNSDNFEPICHDN